MNCYFNEYIVMFLSCSLFTELMAYVKTSLLTNYYWEDLAG
jgi:hypothetical protein